MHKVTILWGSNPEGNEPCDYAFDTAQELAAFMLGVDEASGWLDYKVIEASDENCKEIEIIAEVPFNWAQELPDSEAACFASLLLNPVIGVDINQFDIGYVPNEHGGKTSMWRVEICGMEALSGPFLSRLVKALAGVGEVKVARAADIENSGGWEPITR